MRVLAVDHGTARCGCAISDPTETISTPIETVEPTSAESVAALPALPVVAPAPEAVVPASPPAPEETATGVRTLDRSRAPPRG